MFALALFAIPASPAVIPYQWKNVEIVGGGFVTGIVPHPTAKDVRFARTDIGGAYRWNPRSRRWTPLMDFLTRDDWNQYGVESVALDPSDPKFVIVATGTYINSWAGNGAILRSENGGNTWERIDLPFKNGGNWGGRSMGERLMVHPKNRNTIFFGTRLNGLQVSKDRGRTWSRNQGLPGAKPNSEIGVYWVHVAPNGDVYAAIDAARPLWQSKDDGATWREVPNQPTGMLPHQAKWRTPDELVLVYGNDPGPNGVTDGSVWRFNVVTGEWRDITPEKPAAGNNFGYGGVALDPANPETLMVSTLCRWSRGDTVFRSRDAGKTWTSLKDVSDMDSTGAPFLKWDHEKTDFGHWIGDVEIDPHNPNRAWYVTGATIWGTENLTAADSGGRVVWKPVAQGLEETAVIDLVSPPSGAHLLSALGDIGGFRHDDFAKSPANGIWKNPVLSSTDDLDFAGRRPSTVVRVGRGGKQHGGISTDGGKTWQPFENEPAGVTGGGSVALSADGTRIVWAAWVGSGAKVVVSTDAGKTWKESVGVPPGPWRVVSNRIDKDVVALLNPNTGELLRSADGATSFAPSPTRLPTGAGKPVYVFGKKHELWVPTPRGIYRSLDAGATFRRVPGLESAERVSFGKAPSLGAFPTVFAIGRVNGRPGVFRSTDEGRNWSQINDAKTGFGTMMEIEGDPRVFGRVYLGTNGRGVLVAEPR